MITPSDLEVFGMHSYFGKASEVARYTDESIRQSQVEIIEHEADNYLLKQLKKCGVTDNGRLVAYGHALHYWLRENANVYTPKELVQLVADER